MCWRTLWHVPATGVSGQLSLQLISQQCCAGMAPSPVAAFQKTVALGPCGSWRTESYNEGVFPFRLHHHHHHHHPVAALGSYADSWRATTSMNCCSWALRQLEDSKRVYSIVIIMWPLLILCGSLEGYRDGDYDDD